MTENDHADWAAYAQQLIPLPGRSRPVPPEPVIAVVAPSPDIVPPRPVPTKRTVPLAVGAQPAGLDKSSWHRFRTGKLPASRTLDLHGRTAQRAHHALQDFLQSAQAEGIRCVEVITGRGAGETGGVLRRELPHWLNQPALRHLVLAASHPHAANPGSVRLLLRRNR